MTRLEENRDGNCCELGKLGDKFEGEKGDERSAVISPSGVLQSATLTLDWRYEREIE